MTHTAPVTCSSCGQVADQPSLTWSSAAGPRGTTWLCEPCTRRHLRSLEAGLDEEHW